MSTSNHSYEFSSFRLEPGKRQLTRNGKRVSLPPKAFDTLLILVQSRGQALKKDDFIKRVWPDSFVDENNLIQYVSLLRKLLSKGGNGEKYIETLPRWGYRFVAEVEECSDEQEETRQGEASDGEIGIRGDVVTRRWHDAVPPSVLGRIWRRRIAIASSSVVIVGVAVALFFLTARRKSTPPAPVSTPAVKTIAVLPFKSLARNTKDDDYLELGLADALITDLGQLHGIKVRPTSAIRRFNDSNVDPVSAGRGLGVDTILNGSFQRSDGRIRITLQLVSVSDNTTLWTEKFDQQFTNIFAVEDDISAKVMRAFGLGLTREDERKLARRPNTTNAEAYRAYLIGRSLWNRRNAQGINKAIEYFTQAIKLDPNYAEAYAGLADSYILKGSASASFAKAAALKAIALDDTLPEPHTALAGVELWREWNWAAAEREFKRALELNPNDATTHHCYAFYFYARGHMDEARHELEQALELDPTSIIINADLGQYYIFARQYEKALAQLRRTQEMDQGFVMTRAYLALTYELMGGFDESMNELEEGIRSSSGRRPFDNLPPRSVYERKGWKGYWQTALERADKAISRENFPEALSDRALIYLRLGDAQKAFESLDKACQRQETGLILLQVHPLFDSLRRDQRYSDLVERMKLHE